MLSHARPSYGIKLSGTQHEHEHPGSGCKCLVSDMNYDMADPTSCAHANLRAACKSTFVTVHLSMRIGVWWVPIRILSSHHDTSRYNTLDGKGVANVNTQCIRFQH